MESPKAENEDDEDEKSRHTAAAVSDTKSRTHRQQKGSKTRKDASDAKQSKSKMSPTHQPQPSPHQNVQRRPHKSSRRARANSIVAGWKTIINLWYPDLNNKTYCVPPCIVKRVPFDAEEIAGQIVLIRKGVSFLTLRREQQTDIQDQKKSIAPGETVSSDPTSPCASSTHLSGGRDAARMADAGCPEDSLKHTEAKEVSTAFQLPRTRATPREPPQRPPHVPVRPQKASTSSPGSEAQTKSSLLPAESTRPKSQEKSPGMPLRSTSDFPELEQHRLHPGPVLESPNETKEQNLVRQQPLSEHDLLGSEEQAVAALADSSQQSSSQSHHHSLWFETDPTVQPVLSQESDYRDDFAQQHMLFCLQKLGIDRKEAMFVVSALNFKDYLVKLDEREAGLFLLPSKFREHKEGDFDIIIIHRRYGILLCEVKSVGLFDEPTDEVLAAKVFQGIRQLNKCGEVMERIISDIADGVYIRKALMLPYIGRARFQKCLNKNKQLKTNLWQCLGTVHGVKHAVDLCVCRDDVSDRNSPDTMTDEVKSKFEAWWTKRMACKEDHVMKANDVYPDLVSKMAGPATTVAVNCVYPPRVELRTLGETVSELGRQMSLLVLTPNQLELLTRAPQSVCLTGPPGTGKTLVLVVKGLMWVREGHTVVVLSTRPASLAVSWLIHYQLVKTLQAGTKPEHNVAERVKFIHADLYNSPEKLDATVESLVSLADEDGRLFVLMDEANFRGRNVGQASQTLVQQLSDRVSHLYLWAARVLHPDIPPQLPEERLTEPLRSTPRVTEALKASVVQFSDVHDYTSSSAPSPFEGPEVIRLCHQGEGHAAEWPVECEQCGREVAKFLQDLNVGVGVPQTNPGPSAAVSSAPLRHRDVFVLTRSSKLHEDSDFVKGLRSEDVPVGVIGWLSKENASDWERRVRDVATAQTDQVTVSSWGAVHGLERKVVVILPGRWQGVDDEETDEALETHDMLHLASRCTTQLVLVEMPRKSHSSPEHPPRS